MTRLALLLLGAALSACSPNSQNSEFSRNCLKLEIQNVTSLQAVLPTDSGMHALWDPEAFRNVCSFESWESAILKNNGIRRHIDTGAFVPIYVHSDGSPLIEVRVGSREKPAVFSTDLAKVVRSSEPYLFESKGAVAVSGIEYIGGDPQKSARAVSLPVGRWTVSILEVEAIAGTSKEAAKTVPDFVALLNPEPSPAPNYRKTEETFK